MFSVFSEREISSVCGICNAIFTILLSFFLGNVVFLLGCSYKDSTTARILDLELSLLEGNAKKNEINVYVQIIDE